MPASRISLVQFSYSDATKASSLSFGSSHTSPPLFSKRSLRSGNEARISVRNFATTSCGVLAGTKIPSQESTSRPGTPASAPPPPHEREGPPPRNRVEEQIDAPRQQIGEGRRRALVRHFQELH